MVLILSIPLSIWIENTPANLLGFSLKTLSLSTCWRTWAILNNLLVFILHERLLEASAVFRLWVIWCPCSWLSGADLVNSTERLEAGINVRQAGKTLLGLPSGHKSIPPYQQFFMLLAILQRTAAKNEFRRDKVWEDEERKLAFVSLKSVSQRNRRQQRARIRCH